MGSGQGRTEVQRFVRRRMASTDLVDIFPLRCTREVVYYGVHCRAFLM